MNFAHIHLILNHAPVVGLPVGIVMLVFGLMLRSSLLQKFALATLVVFSLFALPVFFSGEPAEDVIINLPGVSDERIEEHEEAAEVALILTLVSGLSGILMLWQMRGSRTNPKLMYFTLALAVAAVGSLAYVANLGGQIRHPEIRSNGGG